MKRIMKNRDGLTLVELMVAMVLLGVMLTSVAALTFEAARSSIMVAGEGYRQGVVLEEVNRLTSMPYSNLPTGTTCRTLTGGVFPHTRCVSGATAGTNAMQITVIVTPAQPAVRPDTAVFVRANAPNVNPLSM